MSYSRFAIYYVPPDGPLAGFGAAWLGWDVARGQSAVQLDLPGLRDITLSPRKYGFHATLKPPFHLAAGTTADQLSSAVADLARTLAPATCEGLDLTTLDGFLALTPGGDAGHLQRVAAACVRGLDDFRAPASEAEMARRRQPGLSPRQEALLQAWGYPYVLEAFRFHLTLSGRLPADDLRGWAKVAEHAAPDLPAPFVLDQIALCGERADGRFECIHRYALAG